MISNRPRQLTGKFSDLTSVNRSQTISFRRSPVVDLSTVCVTGPAHASLRSRDQKRVFLPPRRYLRLEKKKLSFRPSLHKENSLTSYFHDLFRSRRKIYSHSRARLERNRNKQENEREIERARKRKKFHERSNSIK